MNFTISLLELAKELHYVDLRSVKKWCLNNNLTIYSDLGSNKKYVFRIEFEYKRIASLIRHLKEKHPEDWLQVFQAYANLNITHVIEHEELHRVIHPAITKNNYQPRKGNKHEKLFLDKLGLTSKSPDL